MKKRLLLKLIFTFAFCLLAPAQLFAQDGEDEIARSIRVLNRTTIPYTKRLPSVDRAELIKIGMIGESGGIMSIAETKMIKGNEARQIAAVWRSQVWNQRYSGMCHQPKYAIKFYSGSRIVLYASVCWDCYNIVILQPVESGQGFKADSRISKVLLKFFTTAFPKR